MGNIRISEGEVRASTFTLDRTLVTESGEVDVFVAHARGKDLQMEIRVHLKPCAPGGAGSRHLNFGSLSMSCRQERKVSDVSVIGRHGRRLEDEMIEVMAWEVIQGIIGKDAYDDPRQRLSDSAGRLLTVGTIVPRRPDGSVGKPTTKKKKGHG